MTREAKQRAYLLEYVLVYANASVQIRGVKKECIVLNVMNPVVIEVGVLPSEVQVVCVTKLVLCNQCV
jgi:hypothetical protein